MNSPFLDFPNDRTEFSDAVYSALGRALTYATAFEANCRSLSSLGHLKARLPELLRIHPPGTDVLPLIVEEIWYRQLHPHTKNILKHHGWCTESDIAESLTKAREARNEIAHTLALGLAANIKTDFGQSVIITRIAALIRKIAIGFMIVALVVLVETREQLPTTESLADYPQKIVRWVTSL